MPVWSAVMNSCQLLKSRIGGSVSAEVSPYNSLGVVRIEAVLVPTSDALVEFDCVLPVASVDLIDPDGFSIVSNSLWIVLRLHPSQGREEPVDERVRYLSRITDLRVGQKERKEDDR